MQTDEITEKFQKLANEILRSFKEDTLTDREKSEWFGYIRAARDFAYDCGILEKTTIQNILEEIASKLYDQRSN